jgi:Dyp-type peroxidase family
MNNPRYSGLDPDQPGVQDFMKKLQAGILKSHGRNYSALTFFRIDINDSARRNFKHWLGSIKVTTALEQSQQTNEFKSNKANNQTIVTTLSLTHEAFKNINAPAKITPRDVAFRDGMKFSCPTRLNETTSQWENFYKKDIHGLLCISCSLRDGLEHELMVRLEEIKKFASNSNSLHIEQCYVKRSESGEPVEHFGFVDGISQPLFFKSDIKAYFDENIDARYDPSADPFQCLVVEEGPDLGFGSYLVFRKIGQDATLFNNTVATLALQTGNAEELAAAMVMGRHRDGTPVIFDKRSTKEIGAVDFLYDQDVLSNRCPLQAHIRRANPRTAKSVDRRIARRGLLFGDSPEASGLAFLAYQSDLAQQFEFIQRNWANITLASDDSGINCGIDPVSGRWSAAGVLPHTWPTPWDTEQRTKAPFSNVANVTGGEYFYTPSPAMLSQLALL